MLRSHLLLFVLVSIKLIFVPVQAEEEKQIPRIEHFRSRVSDVYIVRNFLPIELAKKWRLHLKNVWNNTAQIISNDDEKHTCSTEEEKQQQQACAILDERSTFYYATNNKGTQSTNNAKFRSLEMIKERHTTARWLYDAKRFSYAKWELHPSHLLVKEINDYMSSQSMRDSIQNIIADKHPDVKFASELSDLFVTLYSTGDFLSPHDDGVAGTWAFIVSLTDGDGEWDLEKYGGGLRFECEADNARTRRAGLLDEKLWCKELAPSFNTAIFLQTRVVVPEYSALVGGPLHEVLSVKYAAEEEGFFRFGFTGWYLDEADKMSESHRQERDKMRARD